MHKHLIPFTVLSLALVPAFMVVEADADVITSSDFRMAYGASVFGTSNAWSDAETVSQNSPTIQGAFLFSPVPAGGAFSGGGLITLADGTATDGVLNTSVSGYLAPAAGFSVPITVQYQGAAPGNAASTPNYRLELVITSLRIWASDSPGEGSQAEGWVAWAETTPGHVQQDAWSQTNFDAPFYNLVSQYSEVTWDPADYSVATGLNDSYTRTFTIAKSTSGIDYRHGDALEVVGRVNLIYDAVIPEPAALGLLAFGSLALLRRRK